MAGTYTAIADSEIDPESPFTTTLATKYRDNNALHFISESTASASATIDITGLDNSYPLYYVEIINAVPANDGDLLYCRVQTGGSTWQTGAVYTSGSSTGQTEINLLASGVENTAAEGGASCNIDIIDPSSTSVYTKINNSSAIYKPSSLGYYVTSGNRGVYVATTAVTGIRFYFSTGSIASGKFRLFGVVSA